MSKMLTSLIALCAAAACSAAGASSAPAPSSNVVVAAQSDLAGAPESLVQSAPAEAAMAQPAQYRDHDIRCEVRASRTSHGVLIEAMAFGDPGAYGDYDLVIAKGGGAGSNDIEQSGEFQVEGDGSVSLGEAEFSLEPGAGFHAELTVHGGGETCRHEVGN